MRRVQALVVTAALATAALAAAAASPVGLAATPSGESARVARMFEAYRVATLARDFETACALTAPETDRALVANLARIGVKVPGCAAAFRYVYLRPGGKEARLLDEISQSTRVSRITVTGTTARIRWSATAQGRRLTVTSAARRIAGAWQIVDVD